MGSVTVEVVAVGDSEGPVTWVSVGEERERETERERERERFAVVIFYCCTIIRLSLCKSTVLLNTSLVYFVYVQTDVEGRG